MYKGPKLDSADNKLGPQIFPLLKAKSKECQWQVKSKPKTLPLKNFKAKLNDEKWHLEEIWHASDSKEIPLYCREYTQPFPHRVPSQVTNVSLTEFSSICFKGDFHAS